MIGGLVVAVIGAAVAEVVAVKRRQQNFRLREPLISAVEAAVSAGRAQDKTDAVEQALEAWLGGAPGAGLLEPTEASDPLPEDPGRWSAVTSAPDRGTLVRVADPERFEPGALVFVVRTQEIVRVRGNDDGVLAVDRGVGTPIAAIQLGDEVCVVGRADLESVEPRADGEPERARSAAAADQGLAPAVPTDASPAGQPPAPAGGGAARESGVGGQGAGSASAVEGGQAGSTGPAPEPSGLVSDADADDAVEAAHATGATVELVPWLAERLGKPPAVIRRWIWAGRVAVNDTGTPVPVTLVGAEAFPVPFLAAVELDGERIG